MREHYPHLSWQQLLKMIHSVHLRWPHTFHSFYHSLPHSTLSFTWFNLLSTDDGEFCHSWSLRSFHLHLAKESTPLCWRRGWCFSRAGLAIRETTWNPEHNSLDFKDFFFHFLLKFSSEIWLCVSFAFPLRFGRSRSFSKNRLGQPPSSAHPPRSTWIQLAQASNLIPSTTPTHGRCWLSDSLLETGQVTWSDFWKSTKQTKMGCGAFRRHSGAFEILDLAAYIGHGWTLRALGWPYFCWVSYLWLPRQCN